MKTRTFFLVIVLFTISVGCTPEQANDNDMETMLLDDGNSSIIISMAGLKTSDESIIIRDGLIRRGKGRIEFMTEVVKTPQGNFFVKGVIVGSKNQLSFVPVMKSSYDLCPTGALFQGEKIRFYIKHQGGTSTSWSSCGFRVKPPKNLDETAIQLVHLTRRVR